MISPLSFGALCLATASSVLAAAGGSFEDGGSTLVSGMMMFLGNEDSVYILDKAEDNKAQVAGHPAWGSLWDVKTRQAATMDVRTNVFCASGMHLPNGSFVTFGGNDAVGQGGVAGSQKNDDGTGAWDTYYQDFDGRRAIRIVNPCRITDSLNAGDCMWYDEPTALSMKRRRWYSAAEPTGEGQIVILGGFVNGGYINRWFPVVDPITQQGQSEPSYEYFPPKDGDPQNVQFLIDAGGLNGFTHTFLMPSGKILLQANLSTTLWDHVTNQEAPLPPMPNNVVRVYPASGAVAMLSLTPANNYTPTMLFCGGQDMPSDSYGDYTGPAENVWELTASKDCQRLTPEPTDGSVAAYEQDDDMLDPRTMGQFVALPDGKFLVINGGAKGTAGYSKGTRKTPNLADMPFGTSLATDPVFTPAIYDATKPKGSRWSNDGLDGSKIPRLYHSTAVLLPDGSVFLAGSNPNPDVNLSTTYPTEYESDIFFPPYFSAKIRPDPQGVPKTLGYGGNSFDITIPATSYDGLANTAADATTVTILRSGFTTHAMNMGQRHMQLENTYTVNKNGTITLHVAQLPPNSNLFQPGPALLFVNINGIPSIGKYIIVGNGKIGPQPTAAKSVLPASIRVDSATGGGSSGSGSGSGSGSDNSNAGETKSNMGLIIGASAGGLAILLLLGGIIGFCVMRKKRAAKRAPASAYAMGPAGLKPMGMGESSWGGRDSSASTAVFSPLHKGDWDSSTTNLNAPYTAPYRDDSTLGTRESRDEFDPYSTYPNQRPSMAHADSYGEHGSPLRHPASFDQPQQQYR